MIQQKGWGCNFEAIAPKIISKKSSSSQLPLPGIWSSRDNIIEEVANQFISANQFWYVVALERSWYVVAL